MFRPATLQLAIDEDKMSCFHRLRVRAIQQPSGLLSRRD